MLGMSAAARRGCNPLLKSCVVSPHKQLRNITQASEPAALELKNTAAGDRGQLRWPLLSPAARRSQRGWEWAALLVSPVIVGTRVGAHRAGGVSPPSLGPNASDPAAPRIQGARRCAHPNSIPT